MGMHAATEAGQKFADLQGWLNQHIAQQADWAIPMVSGLPLVVKCYETPRLSGVRADAAVPPGK